MSTQTRSAALLLDLDRTLVDVQTFTDYGAAVADVERDVGDVALIDLPDTEWRSETRKAMAILASLAGLPEQWAMANTLIEEHELNAVEEAQAMPGLESFLAATSSVPRVIVTLMGERAMDAVCARFGIGIEHRVGRRAELAPKPAPDQPVAACRLLDVSPAAAVMLGDSTWDQVAAETAGLRFVGLTNGKASEFTPGTALAADLTQAVPLLLGID